MAANSDKMQLNDLADLADRVFDNLPTSTVSSVAAQPQPQTSNTLETSQLDHRMSRLESMMSQPQTSNTLETSQLDHRMSRLEGMMSQLLHSSNKQPPQHRREYSRSKSRGRFNPTGQFCFYHFKYGTRARKCIQPCSWKDSSKNEPRQ